jgi:sterol desaturase/sphingolipid hydroxylase (fatty acid hydroxylase superfamily)
LGFDAGAVLIATGMLQFLGLFTHVNARLAFGPLNYVLATSANHRWHHNIDPEDGSDRNFGLGLILWDRLFGSFHFPVDRAGPEVMGRDGEAPEGFVDLLQLPFERSRVGLPRTR